MKTYRNIFLMGAVILAVVACNPKEDLNVTYFMQHTSLSDGLLNEEDSLFQSSGLLELDSVRFSDGSYAVHRLRNAPQNSLTEFFDSEGRTIATISRASECYAQTLVYGYDSEGRLAHLLRYKKEIFEGLEPDSTNYGRTQVGYLGFRQMIADIDYAHPDTAQYEQTNIEYNERGEAVKAYVVYGSDSIVAPEEYKLTVAVEPCVSFWQSDVTGGFYIFHVKMEPETTQQSEYTIRRFADYQPSMESFYRDGYIVKTIWHHDAFTDTHDKDLVFVPEREGALNIYTKNRADGSKRQRAYKNGRLAYVQTVSKQGTVIKKEVYTFLSDKQVRVTTFSVDFKTMTLKKQSASVVDVPSVYKYREDMDVVSDSYRWENYYNK